ncbi:MAG: FAD binding domain-containing protein, partial [Acidimicrobiia bacterium]
MLNLRIARPTTVVDISRIPGLQEIEMTSESVAIGALTTHSAIETYDWPGALSALPEGTSHIGYPAIRHRGTLGGSLAHADPAAELPSLMVALDASIALHSSGGTRTVASDEFFTGYYSTARNHDELLTAVNVPISPGLRTGFAEFSRRTGDFAIALAATATWTDDGSTRARVVVGGLDVRPRRIGVIEEALINGGDWREVCTPEVLAVFTDPSDDIHGSADYRLRLGAEMVRRAISRMEGEV